jgi:threonylcarbamoyladenosine tRNA methylthiotransferase MtaB
MNRRYTRGAYLEKVARLRELIPDISLTTDIIVGFPGETEDEWRQTLDFVEQARFGHIHIFAFSPREGTKAATLPGPVSREIQRERSQQLHELAARQRCAVMQGFVGRDFEVLIEGRREIDDRRRPWWSGYTPNFLRVRIESPDDADWTGRIMRARLERIADDGEALLGRVTG